MRSMQAVVVATIGLAIPLTALRKTPLYFCEEGADDACWCYRSAVVGCGYHRNIRRLRIKGCIGAHYPPSCQTPPDWRLAKKPLASQGPGFSPLSGLLAGEASGTAQLMSHHMSNMGSFAQASDDECLSLVACIAFERAAFDAWCVQRLNQSDRTHPAAGGA